MNRRFSQGRWFVGVAVLVVLIGVLVGAFALDNARLERELGHENARLGRELALKERARELALKERAPGYVEPGPALGPGRIALVSDRDGDTEIYVMNADGNGLIRLRTTSFAIIILRGRRMEVVSCLRRTVAMMQRFMTSTL